jgi:hypothetical protein
MFIFKLSKTWGLSGRLNMQQEEQQASMVVWLLCEFSVCGAPKNLSNSTPDSEKVMAQAGATRISGQFPRSGFRR